MICVATSNKKETMVEFLFSWYALNVLKGNIHLYVLKKGIVLKKCQAEIFHGYSNLLEKRTGE